MHKGDEGVIRTIKYFSSHEVRQSSAQNPERRGLFQPSLVQHATTANLWPLNVDVPKRGWP